MGSQKELTPKQERFCLEYIIDLNATQAATRAGYSEKTAHIQGYQLLQKPLVTERISQLKERQAIRTGITADRILLELERLATVDLGLAYDDAGFMKPLSEIPEDVRRAMQTLETSEIFAGQGEARTIIGHARKARFHDKNKALELLGKHLKLFVERTELTGKDGGPIETKDLSRLSDDEVTSRFRELMEKASAEKEST